jgi:peptide/nickel transport system substrate-binding protein
LSKKIDFFRNIFYQENRSKTGCFFLVTILITIAILIPLVSCASPGSDVPFIGTLRIGTSADTKTLDPALLLNNPDIWVTEAVYDNLVTHDYDMTVKSELAESWEPNEDLTSYTFQLRKGVKFHNGKELNSEDVVFSIKRLIDPKLGSPAKSSLDFIVDIVAVDDYTVRFDMEEANAFLPDALCLYQGRIIPSNIDTTQLTNNAVGTGPFKLVERLPGERTVLERNSDYWDEGVPHLNEIIFYNMPDPTARLEALKTGSVDLVYPLSATDARGLEGIEGVHVSEATGSSYLTLAMDVTAEPFNDVNVRKAIQMSTDREAVQQVALFGHGMIGRDHPIPPNDPHFATDVEVPAYNPEGAKLLLEKAGYPDGLDLTLHTSDVFPGNVELAVAFKESAAPAGIRVNIQRDPEEIYWSDIWLKVPFMTVNWLGRIPDAALSVVFICDADWNEAHYCNPYMDELVFMARTQDNIEDRRKTYAEIQQILVDDVPEIIPVFMPVFMGLRDNVQGVEAHPTWRLMLAPAYIEDIE